MVGESPQRLALGKQTMSKGDLTMEKAKEKKEVKFNSAKIARQVEKSLKAVFPKAKFFVSDAKPVEAITLDQNGYAEADMEMFRRVFCVMARIEMADLVITRAKRESPNQAPAK
jgi:hypothetical protein